MKTRKLLLLGGNFSPELTGIGKYNGELVEWLSQQGISCTVVTTFPYYPHWEIQEPYKKRYWFKKEMHPLPTTAGQPAGEIKVIRCPHYVPKIPNGFKRILSDCTIFFTASLVVGKLLFAKKFDSVISVAPPFQLGILAIWYKKVRGARFLYHIQDLQIDAARDLKLINSTLLLNTLFKTERFILKSADIISSISEGMIKKVYLKCNNDILFFRNWVDVNKFFPITQKQKLKEAFGFKATDKIVMYSGAVGHKQGLEGIIHAAKAFAHLPDVTFIIAASGPYKGRLMSMQQELGVQNIVFMPLQPAETFNAFLNMADIHLVLQKANAGDLVMPSKLTTILSVGGLAIVSASPGTSLYNIIAELENGLVIEPENQEALNTTILYALQNDMSAIQKNARAYAERHLCKDTVLAAYATHIFKAKEELVKNRLLKSKKESMEAAMNYE